MQSIRGIALLLAACFVFPGCAVNEVIEAEETELIVAEAPPEEGLLLDIGIIQFAEGVPKNNDSSDSGVFEEIRSAESRYLAYHGTTMGALSITGISGLKAPFEPLIAGAIKVPNTNRYAVYTTMLDCKAALDSHKARPPMKL